MAGILFYQMKKKISLFISLLLTLTALAQHGWKQHPTFDGTVTRLVDTPRFVYFTSRTQPYVPGARYNGKERLSLFRFDKEGEELMALSSDNLLMSANVAKTDYSPEHGMMAVADERHGLSLLYDDGRHANVSAYRNATTDHDKTVNSIFIDPSDGTVTLCTAFGLVTVDPSTRQITESRIFGTPVVAAGRTGEMQLISVEGRLLYAPFSSRRGSQADYSPVSSMAGLKVNRLLNPDSGSCLAIGADDCGAWLITYTGGEFDMRPIHSGRVVNAARTNSGVVLTLESSLLQVSPDGSCKEIALHPEDHGLTCATDDMKEVWTAAPRRGLWSRRIDGSGNWSLTRDCITPDAPAPFRASDMVWHPDYGLLIANHGYNPNFPIEDDGGPVLLSAYRGGRWTSLSPAYTAPGQPERMRNPNGLAVDPDNPDLIYFGSLMNGMLRINTADGTDQLHFSRAGDPCRDLPGFMAIVADQSGEISPLPGVGPTWTASSPFAGPKFDARGNLWTAYADYDDQNPVKLHLICWESSARKASSSGAPIPPVMVKEEGIMPGNRGFILPLMQRGHTNLLAYSSRKWDGDISLIDTGGTPADPSDDKIQTASTFTDRDGSTFPVNDIRFIHEDPSSGDLWIGHRSGIFTIDPSRFMQGDMTATRIKVARGDGTNLADYLLDGVPVNGMTEDSRGHKWFATGGAGVVRTSPDGSSIIEELTAANSPIPDDNVYGIGYIPESNSIMVSTENGIAEHFLGGTVDNEGKTDIRIFPNPVRPGYAGYVTIDGLDDNALVKIVDASGALVRELGYAAGGVARWDVAGLSGKRVAAGVYYVLCTSGPDDNTVVKVGKLLVVN